MSAARPDTWMPLYWGDYARDTAHLNATLHGAYMMLIKHYWCSGKPLPDDDGVLWRVASCDSPAQWRKLRPTLAAFFQIANGVWRHRRIDAELEKAAGFARRQRDNGRKGGRPANPDESQTEPSGLSRVNPDETKPQPPSPSPSPSQPPPSPRRTAKGLRAIGEGDLAMPDALRCGPTVKRLKRQDVADRDMAVWLTARGGMDGQRAWGLLIAARDGDAEGHAQAARELEKISRDHRLGWFAEEDA